MSTPRVIQGYDLNDDSYVTKITFPCGGNSSEAEALSQLVKRQLARDFDALIVQPEVKCKECSQVKSK